MKKLIYGSCPLGWQQGGRNAADRCGIWKEGSHTLIFSYVIVHKAKYIANKSTCISELSTGIKTITHENITCSDQVKNLIYFNYNYYADF